MKNSKSQLEVWINVELGPVWRRRTSNNSWAIYVPEKECRGGDQQKSENGHRDLRATSHRPSCEGMVSGEDTAQTCRAEPRHQSARESRCLTQEAFRSFRGAASRKSAAF